MKKKRNAGSNLLGWWLLPLLLWPVRLSAAVTAPSEYARQLTESAQRLRIAAEHPDRSQAQTILLGVRERLPIRQAVENQGAVARVDYTWLYEVLHAAETDSPPETRKALLIQAAERLETIAQQVQESKAPALSGPAARVELQKILSRAEFKFDEGSEEANGLGAWLRKALGWLWYKLFGARSRPTQWPIIQLLFGVAIVALLTLMVSYIRSTWYRPPALEPGALRPGAVAAMSEGSASALMAQALRYAEAGNYRWAIRFLYLALLAVFSEREWIRPDERKTNWEYLNEIKTKVSDAHLLGLFAGLTAHFDRVWYGERACAEGQYREFFEQFQLLEKAIRDQPSAISFSLQTEG